MAIKAVLFCAFAAIAAAAPQHAEHLGKAHLARRHHAFAHSDLAARTVSYDGSCGSWSGMTCPGTTCCSSQGWCGSSPLHCGTGCQAGFGQCGSSSDDAQSPAVVSPSPEPAPATTVSTISSSSTTLSSSTTIPSTTSSSSTTSIASTTSFVAAVASDLSGVSNKGHDQPQPGVGFDHPNPVSPPAWIQPTSSSAPQATASSHSSGLGDTYTMYKGDGSLGAGWPAESSWVDFDTAFENNRNLMSQSCSGFGAADNSNDEINNFKSALQSVAASTGVDSRFLLAIAMQESGGCVRAPTTNYGVRNPGIFQSHDGSGTCNNGGDVQNPCPMSEISQMVTDGAAGTAAGDGLKQTLAQAGTSDVSKYYRAARLYNSGSIAASGQLQDGIATHCYSSDVANRLTGWVYASHGCSQ